MAPVPVEPEIRYAPLAIAGAHAVAATYFTATVAWSLYKSYIGLTPSQDTRARFAQRVRLAPVFAALALVSLALSLQSTSSYATLSYRSWAHSRGLLDDTGARSDGEVATGRNETARLVARWLTDTPVYRDAWELVAEESRRFWWAQHVNLALVSWSLLLAIEGGRKRIPFKWAFLLLAHTVNLSLAQNLFYLALILTPAPLPVDDAETPGRRGFFSRAYHGITRVFPPKPANWCPYPSIYLAVALLTTAVTTYLPQTANTTSFTAISLVFRALTFVPLALPTILPVSLGTVHPHPHSPNGAYTGLFRWVSGGNVASYLLTTIAALTSSAPPAWRRHRHYLPWSKERVPALDRATTAAGRVLTSASDHPIVAAVASDALLSLLALGTWTAVRALGADQVLAAAVPIGPTSTDMHVGLVKEEGRAEAGGAPHDAPVRRRGRKPKAVSTSSTALKAGEAAAAPVPPTPRKRGRPRKVREPEPEPESEVEDLGSARDPAELPGDDAYEPTAEERRSAVEGDVVVGLDELDWEGAAVAWGLSVAGGLGWGSAAVFGAECVVR